ncbi:Gryzun, putative trafficking through golgi-domain-containing protein [Myxozyma melibiosi]|uniref:Gryzun, putative trafficking through golgi-domain-containing protein n=1 Tax=Myxozyma melibiosi TaxID=54550 RepID=A0ABR1F787_9ASCO
MDLYPVEYMCHNVPLMALSGLTTSRIAERLLLNSSDSDTPASIDPEFPYAAEIFKAFMDDSMGKIWEPSAVKSNAKPQPMFRVIAVDKNYQLPLKKASPMSPGSISSVSSGPKSTELHSPLSPLSPESPIYPDGIISQFWLRKYRNALPAVYVGFYELYTESEDVKTKVNSDGELIKELNELKKYFAERNVKFTAVIVSRKSILQSVDLNDRISYLRKSTGLDARSGLCFIPPSSYVETQVFAKELKAALYPTALDFYGSLLKHARKKRGHNASPPSSLSPTQVLSPLGWEVRYEFKQAVFAEYRQDMDLAIKLYGIAYESLLEYFETLPTDSTRWNEARVILDTVAFKILKCNLYLNQPVMAQKVFNVHMQSIEGLVEKTFGTTESYSFYCWKALQYQVLAQLLDLVPETISPRSIPFVGVETEIVGPDFPPSNLLHHAGYQYLNAAKLTEKRKAKSGEVTTGAHDTYMNLPPDRELNFDHNSLILSFLESAYSRFDKSDGIQTRMQAYIAHEIARLHFSGKRFADALKYFHLAEGLYRKERWYDILGYILGDAIYAAEQAGNKEELVRVQFEFMSRDLQPWNDSAVGISRFISESDQTLDGSILDYVVSSENVVCFLDANFAFMAPEIHVSSTIGGQLTIHSKQIASVGNVVPTEIQINFSGSIKPVVIRHDPSAQSSRVQKLDLQDDGEVQSASASLEFGPDEMKTFEISQSFKKVESVSGSSVLTTFAEKTFVLKVAIDLETSEPDDTLARWFVVEDGKLVSQRLTALNPRTLTVKPKPPRLDITSNVKGPAYIDEKILLPLTVKAKEAEDIKMTMSAKVTNVEGQMEVKGTWSGTEDSTIDLGVTSPDSEPIVKDFALRMPAESCDLVMVVTVKYQLLSDPNIDIIKTHVVDIPVIFPFQVSYDLTPQIYPNKWPSPFFIYDLQSHNPPITKRWRLAATIDAVDMHNLEIEDYEFKISNTTGVDVKLLDGPKELSRGPAASDAYTHAFVLDVTNNDAVERRVANADARLSLKWRRKAAVKDETTDGFNIFNLPVLKLTFPLLEPRVLLDLESTSSELVHLVYYIENATSHILTFSVTLDLNTDMSLSYPLRHQLRQQSFSKNPAGATRIGNRPSHDDESEGRLSTSREKAAPLQQHSNFNYEGAKQVGVRVLPSSSRRLDYDLLPLAVTSGWQKVPALRVYDTHFKKTLSVFPASDKFRIDFKTGAVYVNISSSPTDELAEKPAAGSGDL